MAYGILIQNANGNIQIDQDYRNYQRIAYGTITSKSINGAATAIAYTTQTSGTYPLVFVRPHNDGDYVGGCYFGGATFGIPTGYIYLCNSGAYDYRVYALDGAVKIDSSTYGIEIFDASGNTVFDSRNALAQVQATVTCTTVWPSSGPMNPFDNPVVPIAKSYTSFGQRPWFMVNGLVNQQIVASGNNMWVMAINPAANTSSVLFSNGTMDSSGNWVPATASGSSGTYTTGFAGGQAIVPLAICY
jgi:hypothetical protein